MNFAYGTSFGASAPEAYERLLLDGMRGDATLFTRDDEIEQAWDILDPVLKAWAKPESPNRRSELRVMRSRKLLRANSLACAPAGRAGRVMTLLSARVSMAAYRSASEDSAKISFPGTWTVSYTHLRAHETVLDLVCRLLLEKK